jgi:hypothetical protein
VLLHILPANREKYRAIPRHKPKHWRFVRKDMQCAKCRLREGRNKFVFGVGNPAADVMFVGEDRGMMRMSERTICEPVNCWTRFCMIKFDLHRQHCQCRKHSRSTIGRDVECLPYLKKQPDHQSTVRLLSGQ